ncbi:hypothetical protein JCM17961_19510 [Endothiovibrio diazotrophicus]
MRAMKITLQIVVAPGSVQRACIQRLRKRYLSTMTVSTNTRVMPWAGDRRRKSIQTPLRRLPRRPATVAPVPNRAGNPGYTPPPDP